MRSMIYDFNGFDPDPESDYTSIFKEFDINMAIYGNIYGITPESQSAYLSSRNKPHV